MSENKKAFILSLGGVKEIADRLLNLGYESYYPVGETIDKIHMAESCMAVLTDGWMNEPRLVTLAREFLEAGKPFKILLDISIDGSPNIGLCHIYDRDISDALKRAEDSPRRLPVVQGGSKYRLPSARVLTALSEAVRDATMDTVSPRGEDVEDSLSHLIEHLEESDPLPHNVVKAAARLILAGEVGEESANSTREIT